MRIHCISSSSSGGSNSQEPSTTSLSQVEQWRAEGRTVESSGELSMTSNAIAVT